MADLIMTRRQHDAMLDHNGDVLRALFDRAGKTKWAIGGVTFVGLDDALVKVMRETVIPAAEQAAKTPVTMGERLMPGCTCGAAANGDFERCRCD